MKTALKFGLLALLAATSAAMAMETTVLSPIDQQRLLADDAKGSGPIPLRVAINYPVSINPVAEHFAWENDRHIWRHAIEVPGATELSLGFDGYALPPGAELYVYDEAKTYVRGPFTAAKNRDHGELWTPAVPGSRAIVELRLPRFVDTAAAKGRSSARAAEPPALRIMHVGAGYRDLFGREGKPNLTRQQACNIDVECPQADPWRDELRSVARYTIVLSGGTFLCTGQLVMDVPGTMTPYMLTANHCGPSTTTDQTMVLYWNYESPNCGQLAGGQLNDFQIGTIYRASRANVDFSLVELEEVPGESSQVYFAGWDATGNQPFSGSVGIHHPNGDEKSISFNNGGAGSGSICIAGTSWTNGFWFVNWEEGTTEPGSSGSALWNSNNKKVIGYLSGGSSACNGDEPNGLSDCYGKVSAAWNGGSNDTQRLQPWLDPNDSGVLQRDGEDPSAGECGDSALNVDEICDDGNTANGDGCSSSCQVESGWECELPVEQRGIVDGSFELGTPSLKWSEFSTNYGSPICTGGTCSFGIGSDGLWFLYFGRDVDGEIGFVEQSIVIPGDATTLSFQLVALNCDSPSDFVRATIDGVEIIRIDGDDPECGGFTYIPRTGNISAFADNDAHLLRIESEVMAVNGGESRFFIDEVSIDGTTTGPGVPGSCSLLPEVCDAEDFESPLAGWTLFSTGVNFENWGSSNDGVCNSNPQTPAGNFTGGAGEAACIDSDAAGAGAVDAYLCGPAIDLTSASSPVLSFLHNYQIDGAPDAGDSLTVLVGTAAPSAGTVGSYDVVFEQSLDSGAAFDTPGFKANLDLSAYGGQQVYACFRYRADFDWYAQIDEYRVTAQSCVNAVDSDNDTIVNSLDNCTFVANTDQRDTNGDGLGNICDPDISNNCVTDFADVAAVKTAFLTNPGSGNWNPDADLDGDNFVGFLDLAIVKAFFLAPPGPSGVPNICD
ncbi:MAG: choice-of-anchor J domain-containing protein [Gammaproteobacteria bacterium]|nr:choice-of-anchor J domain-containing protein [Gammaproteobacteria bacterium]